MEGFTAEVATADLVEVGRARGVAVLHDVGSGSLVLTEKYGMAHEPTPQESIKDGAGLVFFSGDKLLGGPQAGIITGKKELVDQLARHPLARAVRIDKLSLASLTATLVHYLKDEVEHLSTASQYPSSAPYTWSRLPHHCQSSLLPVFQSQLV